jgi:hypothetical protein
MGLLSRQSLKFDKYGSVHNVIRKNKESSRKRKNAISDIYHRLLKSHIV